MGLDMYLDAVYYHWSSNKGELRVVGVDVPDGRRIKKIVCEAAYWRKVNHVHRWFVENVQDGEDECNPYEVGHDTIRNLIAVCEEAIDTKDSSILPPKEGFFFGGTEIDEYYWNSIQQTIVMLKKALNDFPSDDWYFIYRSSW